MDGRGFECDDQGYLLDSTLWNRQFAEQAARAERIDLTDEHWAVVNFLRDYYARFGFSPAMRVLVKALAPLLGESKASSRRLYQLFPEGPAKQACKVAGLPKPEHCL